MSDILLYEGLAPSTPPAGTVLLYAKVDGRFYFKASDGIEYQMRPQGAGTGDLLSDGSVQLIADWDVGSFKLTAEQLESDVITGTAPFIVASTTMVTNLNVEFLNGLTSVDFASAAQGVLAGSALQPADVGTAAYEDASSFILEANLASQGEAEAGADNTKWMSPLRTAQAIAVLAAGLQNKYDGAAPPTATDDVNAGYSVGSYWIDIVASPNESYRCTDNTATAAVWIKTTLTSDELATVAVSGNSDDLTEGSTKLLMTTAERTSLGTMEDNAKDDQTDAEIEAAYNNQVPAASTVEAEAGTEAAVRRWSPERIAEAIAALGGSGGGGGMEFSYVTVDTVLTEDTGVYSEAGLNHTIPAAPAAGTKCSVWDVSDNAGSNAITITDGTEVWDLNMNGGRFDFLYDGTQWRYSYVVQTIQPDTTIQETLVERTSVELMDIMYSTTGPSRQAPAGNTIQAYTYVNYPAAGTSSAVLPITIHPLMVGPAVRFRFVWKQEAADAGTVFWQCGQQILAGGDPMNAGLRNYNTLLDGPAPNSINNLHVSDWFDWDWDWTGRIPNSDELFYFYVARVGDDVSDTSGAVRLLFVDMEYTIERTITAAVTIDANAQSRVVAGTTDTLLLSDNGKEVIYENAANIAVTLPDGFPEGWNCIVSYTNTGVPTVTPATDTVNGALTGVTPLDQWEGIHLHKYKAGAYIAKGVA